MLEPLFTLIKELWEDWFKFFVYVPEYKTAIILRNGTYHHTCKTGYNWKWPALESTYNTLTIPTTYDLKQQSLVTKDNKTITVRGMIKSKVIDARKFLLEVFDQADALGDTTMGVIARIIMDSTSEEVMSPDINNRITIKARTEAKKYGIEVIQVTLIDISPSKSLRLFTGSNSEESKS
jgi:regulator of protease activity HflC (stomatin/prohibitin superfamily)